MDYSSINDVIYRLGIAKEEFVIGGHYAAGFCEPEINRGMGDAILLVYVSSSKFEELKGLDVMEQRSDMLHYSNGKSVIEFKRGIPVHWVTENGYLIIDPMPLRNWLEYHGYPSLARKIHDVPFEQRLAKLLTREEEEFKLACKGFDWHYEYSDDTTIVRAGNVGFMKLKEWRDRLGGNAVAIFDYYYVK